MRRRDFVCLLGGAVLSVRAQPPSMPLIGIRDPKSLDTIPHLLRTFRDGLKEIGYAIAASILTIALFLMVTGAQAQPVQQDARIRACPAVAETPSPQQVQVGMRTARDRGFLWRIKEWTQFLPLRNFASWQTGLDVPGQDGAARAEGQ
jgi:hypothetical protein